MKRIFPITMGCVCLQLKIIDLIIVGFFLVRELNEYCYNWNANTPSYIALKIAGAWAAAKKRVIPVDDSG